MSNRSPLEPNTLQAPGALQELLDRIPSEAREPMGALATLLLAGSVGFYLAEREKNRKVDNLGDAFWWALATVSSVGYGDIVPITALGRTIGSVLTVAGGRCYQQLVQSQDDGVAESLREILQRLERIEQATVTQ